MERHRLYQGQRQLLYAGIHSASHTDWASVRAWNKTAMPVYPVAGVAFSTIVICWIILRIPYADRAFKL